MDLELFKSSIYKIVVDEIDDNPVKAFGKVILVETHHVPGKVVLVVDTVRYVVSAHHLKAAIEYVDRATMKENE